MTRKKKNVMFVCLGNICRSPAAAGILKSYLDETNLQDKILVESSGVGDWHVGQPPDERMSYAAKKKGFYLENAAKQFHQRYFDEYDLILVSDHEVADYLKRMTTLFEHHEKIFLMTEYSYNYYQTEVPDPYYSGEEGFDRVIEILEDSCRGLLEHLTHE